MYGNSFYGNVTEEFIGDTFNSYSLTYDPLTVAQHPTATVFQKSAFEFYSADPT